MASQEQQTNDNNQTEIELKVSKPDETANTAEQNPTDPKPQTNEIPEALQTETSKHVAHPSIVAMVNKTFTWKECLNPFHLLRLGISGGIAMLSLLTVVGLAYALNPIPCIFGQPDDDKETFEPDGIYNQMIFCWKLSIFIMPAIVLFGHEWLWSPKRVRCIIFLAIFIIFFFFLPGGFMYKNVIGSYVFFLLFIGVLFALIFIFCVGGFYTFWIIFPFGIAAIFVFLLLIIATTIFDHAVSPDGDYFSTAYIIYLLLIQSFAMKFHLYAFPYKWGKCCTCCCNKGKSRQARALDATVPDELSETVIFWYSMIIITATETFRMAGYTALQNERGDFTGFYWYICLNIISEVMTRNAVVWEIIYQCILKKPLPMRSRVDAIYYGATNQGEFIPIWTLLLINVFNYGPSLECCRIRNLVLSPVVDIFDNWWLIMVMLGTQLIQIVLSEVMVRLARCLNLYGKKNEKGEDLPRKVILVEVNLRLMCWILIHCYIVSLWAFEIDNDNRNRPNQSSNAIQNVAGSVNDDTMLYSTMFPDFGDFSSTMFMNQLYFCSRL